MDEINLRRLSSGPVKCVEVEGNVLHGNRVVRDVRFTVYEEHVKCVTANG